LPPPNGDAWWRRLFGAGRAPSVAVAAPPLADDAPAAIGGRYRLRALLGRGAVAAVYLADDCRTGTVVALKLMPLAADWSPQVRDEWRERIAREVTAASRLRHPDIVAMFDAGIDPGQAWLALEYVGGVDLSRYTQPQRLLPEPLVLRLGARIARALAHAHRRGIVHRDLKPGNVLVNLPQGVLKLADFGIARLHDAAATRTGMTLGTPAYMAPELLHGEAATPAADTYALGVLLYELLSGRRPREAATLGELLRAVAQDDPVDLGALRPDLPGGVADAVHDALRRVPGARPADLDAYARELDRLAQAWTARATSVD
jgi:eukaryotic-like serine/threonine-protein kinase